MIRPVRFASAVLLCVAATAAPLAGRAAHLAETAPLKDANLFISPSGQPYRSKPGEPYPAVAWFRQTDADKDGKLDKAEFEAEAQGFFRTLDRNGDGVVTDPEISYYEKVLAPEITAGLEPSSLRDSVGGPRLILVQGRGGAPGGGIDPGGGGGSEDSTPAKTDESRQPRQGAAIFGLLNDPEPVRSADRQLEGRITLADFLARADHNFDRLDYEGRGYLTLDGLPHTQAQDVADPARRA